MSWSNKEKVPQSFDEGDIVTPDLFQILVGAAEDLILVFRNAGSNWSNKQVESPGVWSNKEKIIS